MICKRVSDERDRDEQKRGYSDDVPHLFNCAAELRKN